MNHISEILTGFVIILLIVGMIGMSRLYRLLKEIRLSQAAGSEAEGSRLEEEARARGQQEAHAIRIEERLEGLRREGMEREQATRDAFAKEMRHNREELKQDMHTLSEVVRKLGSEQAKGQGEFRDKLDEKMKELRLENSQKLEEMRKTVDEKLQSTLEKRLSESFKTVSERLEAVHQGLGEMQNLATGVGDLKRVLTNVKSRGTFGEVQLGLLIEDFLTPDQFIPNYDAGKKSGGERVEFGIRVPGVDGDRPVYLPVDAKFPTEDYERLLAAVEIGDSDGIEGASKSLERSIRRFAKDVSDKYINPPHTTDWAILFLPTEGLYAEILRRPGLFESLQRDLKVTVAGPTNFQVLLSTFRMGFRQLVLQERASEVWDVLGAVKLEFGRFGDQIDKMGKSLNAALNHVEKLDTRKRVMLRALKGVEELEESEAIKLIGADIPVGNELFDGEE
jgi:DNA recombination protein RmuC